MSLFGAAKRGFGKAYKAYKQSKIKSGRSTREERIKYGERSPDIKSVKPTKDIKGSVERGRSKEYSRRIDKLHSAERKVSEGKKMMKEGQRERKRMQDTGTAFKFKHSKHYHALAPGDKTKYNIDKKGISKGSK
jgi:hypothetical protein